MSGNMSIILSGLIHIFRPLLSSLSGILDCTGVHPWYFLLGLRIVAIFFANGPWDSVKEDVACNFVGQMEERSRDFCRTLCHNQYFPISVSATWAFVFIVLLLLIGLMKLTSPEEKKKEKDDREDKRNGLAVIATAPHGSPDRSTVYWVGNQGLPRRYGHHPHYRYRHYYPHEANWNNWHGMRADPMAGGDGGIVSYGPGEETGYGMPVYPGHMDQPAIDPSCDVAQRKMTAYPTDSRQTKMPVPCPAAEQYGMPMHQSPMRQIKNAPYGNDRKHCNARVKSAPASVSGSPHKSKMPPQCWQGNEQHHGVPQQRYIPPQECGPGRTYVMGAPKRCLDQGKVPPRYCEDGKGPPAVKRRAVQGVKMRSKGQVAFDEPFDVCNQPWLTEDGDYRPIGGPCIVSDPTTFCHGDATCMCPGTDPCHTTPQHDPPCERNCCVGSNHNIGSPPGPQDKAKLYITKICGIPLFDVWVALLLATEICFLCAILLLQVPKLFVRTWICSSGAASCPQNIECAVKGRAEKRVALWALAFTSILFIIACSGYFHLRMCWNRRCRRMCGEDEDERREEECNRRTQPEERGLSRDAERGNEENGE